MSEVRVCSFDELEPGGKRKFEVDHHTVCVIRIEDDLYAISDTCSHEDYSLCDGELYDEDLEIECWKHGSTFSLVDGEPQSLPATRPVPVYDVIVEGDDVLVKIS